MVTGFFGGLVLSAVKRSLDAKEWGQSIRATAGCSIGSMPIALSAPIFFHLAHFLFEP